MYSREWNNNFFFQAEDGIRDYDVTGVQTCALPIFGLKVIKVGAASKMALHRFQFEAQTLAKLSHPNIEIGRASCRERV